MWTYIYHGRHVVITWWKTDRLWDIVWDSGQILIALGPIFIEIMWGAE
jgi:hypothetical protein